MFLNCTSWFCSVLWVAVHWSISPTFLPNRTSLLRITGGWEKSSDNRARDERQTVTFSFVFIGVISLLHTWLVMLSHSLYFLFSPESVLSASPALSTKPLKGSSGTDNHLNSLMSPTQDRINVTNNPVVTISLTAMGARPLLLLLLAGKAQCYPSSFLCWPLPLIVILLSVSAQSFKGARVSVYLSHSPTNTDITSGLTDMEWKPKTHPRWPCPMSHICLVILMTISPCQQLVLKERSKTTAMDTV